MTEEEAPEEEGPFGGLSPGEASRRRWEKARERAGDPFAADPRRKMAQQLQKKAEQGDLRAYEAWRQVTDELEQERLARDGADGARAWEQITPEQRRLLLHVLDPSTQLGEVVQLVEKQGAHERVLALLREEGEEEGAAAGAAEA